ncbi:MAG: GIY-YIG nuclease family protein, partial [Methanobacterium sp.]
MIGVYKISNKIDGKSYYGSSKNIEKRWLRHKNELNKNKHINILLQRAWNKYGEENFIFSVVEE